MDSGTVIIESCGNSSLLIIPFSYTVIFAVLVVFMYSALYVDNAGVVCFWEYYEIGLLVRVNI